MLTPVFSFPQIRAGHAADVRLHPCNITPIQCTADECLKVLEEEITPHLLKDVQEGLIEARHALPILMNMGVRAEFKIDGHGQFALASFGAAPGRQAKGHATLTIVQSAFDKVKAFVNGEAKLPIELTSDEILSQEVSIEGVVLPLKHENGTLFLAPPGTGVFAAKLTDEPGRSVDVQITAVASEPLIVINNPFFEFRMIVDEKSGECKTTVQILRPDKPSDPSVALRTLDWVSNWAKTQKAYVTMLPEGVVKPFMAPCKGRERDFQDFCRQVEEAKRVYSDTLRLSRHHGIELLAHRLDSQDERIAFFAALRAMNGEVLKSELIRRSVTLQSETAIDELVSLRGPYVEISENPIVATVFGKQLTIGYFQVTTPDVYVANIDEIRRQIEGVDFPATVDADFKSRTGSFENRYTTFQGDPDKIATSIKKKPRSPGKPASEKKQVNRKNRKPKK